MEEMIDISVAKDKRELMIKAASQQVNTALSGMLPPFNGKRDVLRLRKYLSDPDRIKLTYEILRDARPSKVEQERSSCGEDVQVSMNG